MTLGEVKKRILKLRKEIDRHRTAYYLHDKPTISDETYDSLFKELQSLEEKHPEFSDVFSPTKKVGGPILEGFTKIKHKFLRRVPG